MHTSICTMLVQLAEQASSAGSLDNNTIFMKNAHPTLDDVDIYYEQYICSVSHVLKDQLGLLATELYE